jgi:F-box protein 11
MSGRIFGGFWSYARADDEHEMGRISRLRDRLERSIRFYSGIREFRIFLDRKDIGWGQKWARHLSESLEDSLLLFPIVTPSYFSSEACREEALAFQKRQAKLGRDDLILPIYYLAAELMDDSDSGTFGPEERAVGKLLSSHQKEDWRTLRITEETNPSYAKAIERLAEQATKALKRGHGEPKVPTETETSTTAPQQAGEDEGNFPTATAEFSSQPGDTSPGHIVTLTVNQMPGRAQFTKISDAVARAPGGARILVSPGHYLESVLIEKPLELVGDGPREDIVIENSGSEPVIFDTNIGIVRNLTLRQSQKEGDDYCVWIKQGRLELEGCDISNHCNAGISVTNKADPRIRKNRIHHCAKAGIRIADARGSYEDNEIFGNGLAGFDVKGASDPTLRRNRIYDGQQAGIRIYDGARGAYEENEIFANVLSGIIVLNGADPIVRRNRVYDGKQSGILVSKKGRGTFEDNDVFGNTMAGVHVRGDSQPVVRRNRIYKSKRAGISILTKSSGTFEENDVYENSLAGIQVSDDANPIVRRNRIHDGEQSGIFVARNSHGVFEENEIWNNGIDGIAITEAADPTVRRNRVRNNKEAGIYVYDGGAGTFEDNDIVENSWSGVLVKANGKVNFHKNRINSNQYEAIWVDEGGSGSFTNNDVRNNKRGAWDVHESALSQVTREGNVEE